MGDRDLTGLQVDPQHLLVAGPSFLASWNWFGVSVCISS